jgi:uncharacterized membrane protein YhaH (DUF805 family)
MGPAEAIRTGLARSFRFSGRASRPEFWWTWAALYALLLAIRAALALPALAPHGLKIMLVAFWIVLLPLISVGTRRLADAGVWRWLFVVTVLVGLLTQALQWLAFPPPGYYWDLGFWSERNGIDLPLSPPQMHRIVQAVRWDILPWISHGLALVCLILAALPSRSAPAPTPAMGAPAPQPSAR